MNGKLPTKNAEKIYKKIERSRHPCRFPPRIWSWIEHSLRRAQIERNLSVFLPFLSRFWRQMIISQKKFKFLKEKSLRELCRKLFASVSYHQLIDFSTVIRRELFRYFFLLKFLFKLKQGNHLRNFIISIFLILNNL